MDKSKSDSSVSVCDNFVEDVSMKKEVEAK
jgi:hypothetical protein